MGTPVIVDFREGENPYANEKPAQKRQTQSQMREERRQKSNERMWERSDKRAVNAEKKAIAKAQREGTGLVLSHRPKKTTADTKKPKRTAGKAIARPNKK